MATETELVEAWKKKAGYAAVDEDTISMELTLELEGTHHLVFPNEF